MDTITALAHIAARSAQLRANGPSTGPALVDVVNAEVHNPADRYARRQALREALWGAVDAGTFATFDDALAAYVAGTVTV